MRLDNWSGIATGRLPPAVVMVISMLVYLVLTPSASAQAPAPSVVPPGNGGVTFDAVRVLSGNNLPRNAGQETASGLDDD